MDLRAASKIPDATLAARLSAPVWTIPLELVERLVTPTGLTFMVRARLRNAAFRPEARLTIRNGRFVAEIDFEEPIDPERQDGLTVMLALLPASPAPSLPFGKKAST